MGGVVVDSDKAYRAGLQDIVDERPTLADTLIAAEEFDLLVWYLEGRIVGARLLAGEEINV